VSAPDYPVELLPAELRDLIDNVDLDPALLAGAGLAAMAIAAAPATLLVDGDLDPVRPIVWLPLLGKRSLGKSPARRHAFRKLTELERAARDQYKAEERAWLAGGKKEGEDPPEDTTRILQDVTIEMLARKLGESPYRAQVSDELASIVSRLGAYKSSGGGGDRDKWLELWSGDPWRYSRVGSGKQIDEDVYDPVVTVCGTLQTTPDRLALLGSVGDGFRARWLPHLATRAPGMKGSDRPANLYDKAIERAYMDVDRHPYRLEGKALRMWRQQATEWKRLDHESAGETDQVLDALSKADTQALRLALVLSEFSEFASPEVKPDTMRAAIAITNYCIDVWRHLTPTEFLAVRVADEKLFRAAEAWRQRVGDAGGALPLSDLTKAKVGGVRNAEQAEDVLYEYQRYWRTEERKSQRQDGRGRKATWLLSTEVAIDVA
jgi:Protein of unknown function (DUF3987)